MWNTKRSDSFHNAYYPALMGTMDAGQGLDLPFTYYSAFNNETDVADPNFANGAPWLMHAPSPEGMVLNEYYDFVPTTFARGDATFALPASPKCTPVGAARSAAEAARLAAAAHASFSRVPLVELYVADMMARRA